MSEEMRGVPRRSVFDTLKERGFVSQCSNEEGLRKLLDTETGHLLHRVRSHGGEPARRHLQQLMFMAHLQRAGHRPIALIGGGTTRIGDPSGKTEMRKILPVETIAANADALSAARSRGSSISARARPSCWTTRSGSRR